MPMWMATSSGGEEVRLERPHTLFIPGVRWFSGSEELGWHRKYEVKWSEGGGGKRGLAQEGGVHRTNRGRDDVR